MFCHRTSGPREKNTVEKQFKITLSLDVLNLSDYYYWAAYETFVWPQFHRQKMYHFGWINTVQAP